MSYWGSLPDCANMLSVAGAEYHIEMRSSDINRAKPSGSLPSSSPISTTVAPCLIAT